MTKKITLAASPKKNISVRERGKITKLIRAGKGVMNGRVPDLSSEPDFTIENVALDEGFAFVLFWQTKSAGFGELSFFKGNDGKPHCDRETMDREFVRAALNKLVDQLVLDNDESQMA